MKVTYLTQPTSRAGQRIPVQDIQHGEKFRVVSQTGMYIANHKLPQENACKFKRRNDHLYTLRPVKGPKMFTWQKCVAYFFRDDSPEYRWMLILKQRKATIIVEIY